ncbi:MAG TPA: hypothetical protein VH275_00190 [Solirubrobacterales bacterium]|jgi:hypothetical protein|nr:hypothetical protein [Solirubrobacterales bacterium]
MTASEAAIEAKRRPTRRSPPAPDAAAARPRLIDVAHPKFREELTAAAKECGYLR